MRPRGRAPSSCVPDHAEDRVQKGIDPDPGVEPAQPTALVHDMVAHGVGGAMLQHDARGIQVHDLPGGEVLGQKPGRIFEPAHGRPGGTHGRMLVREPHLVVDGVGARSQSNGPRPDRVRPRRTKSASNDDPPRAIPAMNWNRCNNREVLAHGLPAIPEGRKCAAANPG